MQKKNVIISVIILLVAALACGGAYYYKMIKDVASSKTISKGVMVDHVEVGGLSPEKALDKVTDVERQAAEAVITLTHEQKEDSVSLGKLGLEVDQDAIQDAIDEAYKVGKEGSLWTRYKAIRDGKKSDADFEIKKEITKDAFQSYLKKREDKFVKVAKDATLDRVNGEWVITDEEEGMDVPVDVNVKAINKLMNSKWDKKDFSYELEVEKASPKYTREDMEKLTSVLGTYTTDYSTSSFNRKTNVKNAASKIDGSIVYPGDTFSVMDKIMPLTADNGYLEAGSYSSGEVIQSYGGGVCQVSTTLYNAVLRAELEVAERHNHQMTVHYVDLSADAAVSDTGGQDFKFVNNLDNAVYIEATANGSTITFTLYGEETRDQNRSVEFYSVTTDTIQPKEHVTKDKNMEEGKEKVVSSGESGYRAQLWKKVLVDGEVKSDEQVNSSYYAPTTREVIRGTKKKKDKKVSKKSKEEDVEEEDIEDEVEETEAPATTAAAASSEAAPVGE